MCEIVFEVMQEDDGGFVACARGEAIVTQADSLDELRSNVKEAVQCHFEGRAAMSKSVYLVFDNQESAEPV